MNLDRLFLIFLCIFLLLFGLFKVTNFQIEWGEPILGFSALAAGIVALIRVIRGP